MGASLQRAALDFADLTGANICGADFSGASLRGTKLSKDRDKSRGSTFTNVRIYRNDIENLPNDFEDNWDIRWDGNKGLIVGKSRR